MKTLLTNLFAWFAKLPWPHQVNHCLVATIFFLVFGGAFYYFYPSLTCASWVGAMAGSMFYVGHEYQQWYEEGQDIKTTLLDAGAPIAWSLILILLIQTGVL